MPTGRFKSKLEPEHEQALAQRLHDAGVELVVLAGFMRLLKEPLITAFPRRIINIHPSLLPKFPGLAAWRQALEAGESETGCTVHYVDLGMDTGPVIAVRRKCRSCPTTPPKPCTPVFSKPEHTLYPQVIADLAGPTAPRFSPEDHLLARQFRAHFGRMHKRRSARDWSSLMPENWLVSYRDIGEIMCSGFAAVFLPAPPN